MKINKEYRTDERNISFREYISEVKRKWLYINENIQRKTVSNF